MIISRKKNLLQKIKNFSIDFGPQHPAAHGALNLLLNSNVEIINRADPYIGLLRCNLEKLIEHTNYIQVLPYFDRLEYVSMMTQDQNYLLGLATIGCVSWSSTKLSELAMNAHEAQMVEKFSAMHLSKKQQSLEEQKFSAHVYYADRFTPDRPGESVYYRGAEVLEFRVVFEPGGLLSYKEIRDYENVGVYRAPAFDIGLSTLIQDDNIDRIKKVIQTSSRINGAHSRYPFEINKTCPLLSDPQLTFYHPYSEFSASPNSIEISVKDVTWARPGNWESLFHDEYA